MLRSDKDFRLFFAHALTGVIQAEGDKLTPGQIARLTGRIAEAAVEELNLRREDEAATWSPPDYERDQRPNQPEFIPVHIDPKVYRGLSPDQRRGGSFLSCPGCVGCRGRSAV